MLELTGVIANNQKLTFLNLSWNFLANSEEHATIHDTWKLELEDMLKTTTVPSLREFLEQSIANQNKMNTDNLDDLTDENFQEKL